MKLYSTNSVAAHPQKIFDKKSSIGINDKRVKEQKLFIEAAKKNQRPPSSAIKDVVSNNVYQEGIKLGRVVAARKGVQFILIGEGHEHPASMDALVGIMEGLKKSKRPVIYVDEQSPGVIKNIFQAWNIKRHKAGTLGDAMVSTVTPELASVSQWENFMWPKQASDNKQQLAVYSMPAALNKISKIFPEMKFFGVDVNHDYNRKLADRDTAMAIRLRAIAEEYPDATVVALLGNGHVPEYQADSPKKTNLTDDGLNLNDPLGEQLSLRYGRDNVHTFVVIEKNRLLGYDKSNYITNVNSGQLDKVIRVDQVNINKRWPRSWLNEK